MPATFSTLSERVWQEFGHRYCRPQPHQPAILSNFGPGPTAGRDWRLPRPAVSRYPPPGKFRPCRNAHGCGYQDLDFLPPGNKFSCLYLQIMRTMFCVYAHYRVRLTNVKTVFFVSPSSFGEKFPTTPSSSVHLGLRGRAHGREEQKSNRPNPRLSHRSAVEVLRNRPNNCLSAASFVRAAKHLRSAGDPLQAGAIGGVPWVQGVGHASPWSPSGGETPESKAEKS